MMKVEYEKNGYFMVRDAINRDELSSLSESLSVFGQDINQYGIRNLMGKVPEINRLALSVSLLSIAKKILSENARPVRAVLFDKLPEANWNVAWHQDTSIVVKGKASIPDFRNWREREGVVHVEPPLAYLENIMTLRIHLDPANTETGVLRVVPKTHKNGRVSSQNIIDIVEKSLVIECLANPGDILVMSPLLFHSSRKATEPKHRRIIHLEYSAMKLPAPLEWYESV